MNVGSMLNLIAEAFLCPDSGSNILDYYEQTKASVSGTTPQEAGVSRRCRKGIRKDSSNYIKGDNARTVNLGTFSQTHFNGWILGRSLSTTQGAAVGMPTHELNHYTIFERI